jgi:hypothetical protein
VGVTTRARVALALLAATALACGAPPDAPADVVSLYLRSLGRDPARSAALVTPGLQARHGLRIEGKSREPDPEAFRLSRAELAWLGVQRKPEFVALASQLSATILEARVIGDDQAEVRARVEAPGGAPYTQTFLLVRNGRGASWRIDRMEQQGVERSNVLAAFVTNPSDAAARAVNEAFGVKR